MRNQNLDQMLLDVDMPSILGLVKKADSIQAHRKSIAGIAN
jgi:hypothetical protein